MTTVATTALRQELESLGSAGLRGVGQVFFQGDAISGALFLLGIAVGSPLRTVE